MSGLELVLKLANLDLDLQLPARGVIAIMGPSGAGKTTLLRAVAGLEKSLRGRVVINGDVWHDDSQSIALPVHHRSLGFVFQESSLFSHLSVRRNVEFGLRRIPARARKIGLEQAIDLLGIESLMPRMPETLSGGERQRVAIARALASNPKLLLMDEPLAALDQQRKAEILPYLDRLHRDFAIPVLYVSHAIDEVTRLADFVVVLEQGAVRATGSVFDIAARSDLPLGQGEHAAALLEATVCAQDQQYALTQVAFSGGNLWLPVNPTALGAPVRLRIQARDVSLTLQPQSGSSILNTLAASIIALYDDGTSTRMVELDANGTRLLSRITRRSADQLALQPGMAVYAQIKGVAILK